MKLLVFSDSHGMPLYMRETLEKHRDVDAVIFLGDGQNDFQMMRALFPNIAFYSVRGNCDLGCGRESFAVRPHARGARDLRRRTVYLKPRLLLGLSRDLRTG